MSAKCIKYHYENDFITSLSPAGIIKAIMEKYKILNETDLDIISSFQHN